MDGFQDPGCVSCEELTFVRLAVALAGEYENIFIINTADDSYVEYGRPDAGGTFKKVSSGGDFYASAKENGRKMVFAEDRDMFLNSFRKEAITGAVAGGRTFTLTYRLNTGGEPVYYSLKAVMGSGSDSDRIVIGVENVDKQVRLRRRNAERSAEYSGIARSLATLFEVIYRIDMSTGSYMEYSASEDYERLGLITKGKDFFGSVQRFISKTVHPEDIERVSEAMTRDSFEQALNETGTYSFSFRQILAGKQEYVMLLAYRQNNDPRSVVVGVRNMDAQVRREQKMEKESEAFSEIIRALAFRYEFIYQVDLTTDEYKEYSSVRENARISRGVTGRDFFKLSQENMKTEIYPEDYPRMAEAMQKDRLLESLDENGTATLNYRLLIDGSPVYVTLFAIRPKQREDHIIIAVENVDAVKRRELAYVEALGSAMDMASRDALTGVKNKHAYVQTEIELDGLITAGRCPDFALAVADINGLKEVNDNQGHRAGDEYIKAACETICLTFKHSPVFRIGGDEFAVLLKGRDYADREELLEAFGRLMEKNRSEGLVTLAVGYSDYRRGDDLRVQDVFERADKLMYDDKKRSRE
ncbi:MAG: GGDEF domain-containing protein [Ruminococcus sp.]|nr:GGDEF domain-containing protein [Ruminococcus sp.]